jgi:hypothetical protein
MGSNPSLTAEHEKATLRIGFFVLGGLCKSGTLQLQLTVQIYCIGHTPRACASKMANNLMRKVLERYSLGRREILPAS